MRFIIILLFKLLSIIHIQIQVLFFIENYGLKDTLKKIDKFF